MENNMEERATPGRKLKEEIMRRSQGEWNSHSKTWCARELRPWDRQTLGLLGGRAGEWGDKGS